MGADRGIQGLHMNKLSYKYWTDMPLSYRKFIILFVLPYLADDHYQDLQGINDKDYLPSLSNSILIFSMIDRGSSDWI